MNIMLRSVVVGLFRAALCGLLFCGTARGAAIDISGMFDADTIVDVIPIADEPDGGGYRNQGEVFGTTNVGVATNIPASGLYTYLDKTYEFGPFGTTGVSPNTWIVPHNTAEELTLEAADQRPYSELSLLHSAVGFSGSGNGTATVTFDDGSFQDYTWDVADSNGNGLDGGSTSALFPMQLFRASNGTTIASDRHLFVQTLPIAPLNQGKDVTKIKFDSTGNGDNGDVHFGIYAIDGVPVPSLTTPIDISGEFNADTLATSGTDAAGTGYRGGNNEKFRVDAPGFPANGTPFVLANGAEIQLGDYAGDNTILMQNVETKAVDVPNGSFRKFYVAHSAVGFNTTAGHQNGTVTVQYADGTTSGPMFWDLADNDGNNSDGQSVRLIDGLLLQRFQDGASWGGRGLWYQEFELNPYAEIDSIEFATDVSADGDADFGVYAVSGVTSLPVAITIPAAAFNADTLATSPSDNAGAGYRGGNNEKFLTAGFPDGTTVNVPNGPTFELAGFEEDNTVLLSPSGNAVIDVADRQYFEISVLHSAVGLGNENNGSLVVHYADGSEDTFAWDVADNDGRRSDGNSGDALTGLELRRFDISATYSDRQLWYQTFVVDELKVVDSLEFISAGIGDSDANYGIYALSGIAVPEPGSAMLLLLGVFGLAGAVRTRRRQ